MKLSTTDIELIATDMENYPAGVPEAAWGHGPMANVVSLSDDLNRIREYG